MPLGEVPSVLGMPGRLQKRGVRTGLKHMQKWAKATWGRGEAHISGKGRKCGPALLGSGSVS